MDVQKQTPLEKAFSFTPDDLKENRQGKLSATQAALLRHGAQQVALIVLGVLGTLGIFALISSRPSSGELPIFLLCLIVPAALILAVTVGAAEVAILPGVCATQTGIAHMAYGMFDFTPPLDNRQPASGNFRQFSRRSGVEPPLTSTSTGGSTPTNSLRLSYGGNGTYRLVVNNQRFRLTREQYQEIQPGALITIYYLPTIHKIVALEIVDNNIQLPEPPVMDTPDTVTEPLPPSAFDREDDGDTLRG
ncbi:MAG: hypothetical protein ABI947_09915 [Chloroflexota bacterium]